MKLHYEAVPEPLLDLIRRLMAASCLDDFTLVGGTALALQLGHRRSVDCDLFTTSAFNAEELARTLSENFSLEEASVSTNTVSGLIDGIKTDLIAHRYPLVEAPSKLDGISLASLPDIAAMKLNAISNRGGKKDFWDLDSLLERFSKEDLFSFFQKKYPHGSSWALEKSLVYFEDAESEPDPVTLKKISWPEVKSNIRAKFRLD